MNRNLNKKQYKILGFSMLTVTVLISLVVIMSFSTTNSFKEAIESKDKKTIEAFANKKNKLLSTALSSNFSSLLKDELTKLNNDYTNKKISENKYVELLSIYKSFDLCNEDIDKTMADLPIVQNAKAKLKTGVQYFNDQEYDKALEVLESINEYTPSYSDAENYINTAFEKLTESTFNKTNNLIKNTNYTEAITLLEDSKNKIKNKNSEVIDEKINEVKDLRMKHLYEYSQDSIEKNINNAAKLKPYFGKLTKDNVNEFDIKSKTNRFIFTDVQKQVTYVFKGSNRNWVLEKEFLCSTGIDNKETLVGYFEVSTKAPWFFSPKYGQGGKNYVQFQGNYLYHSIPLASNQTTVLDYTLGEPASHGCIRLDLEDSKWLYDNTNEGATVLIF